jgi:hypothetical protein
MYPVYNRGKLAISTAKRVIFEQISRAYRPYFFIKWRKER